MLSRRILRVKIFQGLYAFFQTDEKNITKSTNEVFHGIERFHDLYLLFLSFGFELIHLAELRIEENRKKHIRTEEDINPNLKFVNNRIFKDLQKNEAFQELIKKKSISWQIYYDEVKAFFTKMRSSEAFVKYMNLEKDSFEWDKEFVIKLFKELLSEDEVLISKIEDASMYWTYEDIDLALYQVIKTVEGMQENRDIKIPYSLKDDEDKAFVSDLFLATVKHEKEFEKVIDKKAVNWELDRIALADIILMKMAMTELIYFPSIPVKVTLNEYIELSKWFSTPKSKQFINGILDKFVAEYSKKGELKKTGRGLMQ